MTATIYQPLKRTPSKLALCKRCSSRLSMGYEEMECLTCGYVDYSRTRALPASPRSVFNSARLNTLRYRGDSPTLAERLAHVEVVRIGSRICYNVSCPFCYRIMEEASLSGKRPEAKERRFKCLDDHRVSLLPCKDGQGGWDGWR